MSEILLYIAGDGDDANDGSEQKPLRSVFKALNVLRWEEYDKAVLFIRGSLTEPQGTPDAMISISGDGLPPIVFRGESKKRPGILNAKGLELRVMSVNDHNTVTIENIVMRGGVSAPMRGGAGLHLKEATFIMESGEITDNNAGTGMGGGVYIGKDSEFIMRGGAITHNYSDMNGGGVMPDDGGVFTMYGGVIARNHGYVYGGGVFVGMDSTFVMHGGVIERNSSGGDHEKDFNGMLLPIGMGGGVYVARRAVFTMNGGEIRQNVVTTIEDSTLMMGSGGGVYVEEKGACTINKGLISQNSAVNCGGGVFSGGVIALVEGSISRNKAIVGGGVHMETGGVFLMKGGFICDNTAKMHGGGVNLQDDSVFTLEDGHIDRNTAGDQGSAIAALGELTITGGNVRYNHSTRKLPPQEDPVVVIGPGGKFYRSGGEVTGAIGMMSPDQMEDTRENKMEVRIR
jgi:hypothetical protein